MNRDLLEYSMCFTYTNGAYEFSVEFCVVKFSSFREGLMDYGIRSGKILRLGIPKAPQGNIQGQPRGHPLFHLRLSVTLLEAIFLFTT